MSKHTNLPTIDLHHLDTITGGAFGAGKQPPGKPVDPGAPLSDPMAKPPVKPNQPGKPSPWPFPMPDPFDPKGKPPGFV